MPKLMICLPYWSGDMEAAFRNARRISDIEKKPRSDVGVCFVPRFDAQDPTQEVVDYVRKKFPVSLYRSIRRCTGWPMGCNEQIFALLQESAGRVKQGEWSDVEFLFLMEADCLPIALDWIDAMLKEWEETKKEGKSLFGSWLPYYGRNNEGHINGNCGIKSTIALDMDLSGCPGDEGWDVACAHKFAPVWKKSGLIKNLYLAREVSDADIQKEWIEGVKPVLIHGVKDDSVSVWVSKNILGRDPVSIQTP